MKKQSSSVVGTNIHDPASKAPLYSSQSKFFAHAAEIEKIESQLPSLIKGKRSPFAYRTPNLLKPYRGEKSRGNILEIKLNLPQFPKNVAAPQVLVFDTPENNAMTIGRMILDSGKKNRHFQLPRFHTGVPAQDDLSLAMQQAAGAPALLKLYGDAATLAERMYIVYLTREGQLTDWHHAMYHTTGVSVPFTVVHAEHAQDPSVSQFSRVTKICPINTEGMIPDKLEILVVGDNTASGMQQIAVVEELLRQIKLKNSGKDGGKNESAHGMGHGLKRLLVVSPLLTLYGASIIARWAAFEESLAVTFVTSGALLGCNLPDRYFSPVLADENLVAAPELIALNHAAYGARAAGVACVRCNWTASFMAPAYALARSVEELQMYGTTNEEVERFSAMLTEAEVKKRGVDVEKLMPWSSMANFARANSPALED